MQRLLVLLAASLLAGSSALDVLRKGPLSSGDKQAVGEALSKALNAMQNHAGSKYGACSSMFPDGKAPADRNSATWLSCKDQFYNAAALVGTKSAVNLKGSQPKYNEKEYEDDWGTEHKSGKYPKESEGKYHHPDYKYTPAPAEAKPEPKFSPAGEKPQEAKSSAFRGALPLAALLICIASAF